MSPNKPQLWFTGWCWAGLDREVSSAGTGCGDCSLHHCRCRLEAAGLSKDSSVLSLPM